MHRCEAMAVVVTWPCRCEFVYMFVSFRLCFLLLCVGMRVLYEFSTW